MDDIVIKSGAAREQESTIAPRGPASHLCCIYSHDIDAVREELIDAGEPRSTESYYAYIRSDISLYAWKVAPGRIIPYRLC
jgi:hypothetical protein